MKTFSELTLSPALQRNLETNRFVQPTPVQSEAIPPALEGRDIVATAQTGTGKTLAFVLPILQGLLKKPLEPRIGALILSPTRELAIQIHETFAKMAAGTGIGAAIVVGGLNEQSQLQTIRKGAQVVIATPGRLSDFLQRRLLKLSSVEILVLDEADRMLDMGFLPTIRAIMATLPSSRQTLFFSATIESSVAHLVDEHLNNPVRIAIGAITKPAADVDLHLYEIDQDRKIDLLQHMLRTETGSFLVFSRTKHGADRTAKRLSKSGFKTACIHGDRTQNQRNNALRGFQQGQYRVLVATDVAARGIHVEGIAHVINYDLPQVPEDFIHRVGRTGRAGQRGTATTFATSSERGEIRKIEKTLSVRLIRRDVSPELPREQKVIVMPAPAAPPRANTRSFAPKYKSRRTR